MKECPFCLANHLLKVPIVHDSEFWFFADMHSMEGANAGLAITKRHIETPFEINEQEWTALYGLLPQFKNFLDTREKPHGYTMGWNVYPTGGQTVPHAHLHIAARYDDEELAGKGIRYFFKPNRNQRKKSPQ